MVDIDGSFRPDVKLSHDEVKRLKKAFEDPEFRKLFKEYADEISDPINRKRYEEEIKQLESERGVDVEFINPVPGHCLKTRHWPDIRSVVDTNTDEMEPLQNSVKVFINICKSDKVDCPEIKSNDFDGVEKKYWSLPHCFTPPRDDLDKSKAHAMVYDVVFHPKAFEISLQSPIVKKLINVTAIQGLMKNYNLNFGKTFSQAFQCVNWQLLSHNHINSEYTISSDYEEILLKTVNVLNSVAYKGVPRPTVIRRQRSDFNERQEEIKTRENEELQMCQTDVHKDVIRKLNNFPCLNNGSEVNSNELKTSGLHDTETKINSTDHDSNEFTKPKYNITYSSDFDLGDCCNFTDVSQLRPPDRLIVNIELPNLISSSCLDLEVLSDRLILKSVKPIAYFLDLKLPHRVDDVNATAKFDKATCILSVCAFLIKPSYASSKLEKSTNEEESCDVQSTSDEISSKKSKSKKVRKRNRRRKRLSCQSISSDSDKSSAEDMIDESDTSALDVSQAKCSTENDARLTSNQLENSELDASRYSISINKVSMSDLILTKDRRLAPVRFRQDPTSLTILFGVRGVLPNTVGIDWAEPIGQSAELTQHDENNIRGDELLLRITFSTQGLGGCTMEWGIVMCTPFTMDGLTDTGCVQYKAPRILSSHISARNCVIVLAKPKTIECNARSAEHSNNSDLLMDCATWWTSIAIGRTLFVGMEDCPFVGMEAWIGSSAVVNPSSPSLACHLADLSISNDLQLCVTNLSTDSCTIHWSTSEFDAKTFPTYLSSNGIIANQTQGPVEEQKCRTIDEINLSDNNNNNNHHHAHQTKFQSNSLLSSNASCTNAPLMPLRSILKQRTFSESSCDEFVTDSQILREAGLARNVDNVFSFEDFTSTSSDEDEPIAAANVAGISRSLSVGKLSSPAYESNYSNGSKGRQRLRSVNFSRRDDLVDYSPKDTVEALQHTLNVRRKKAGHRGSRKRFNSGQSQFSSKYTDKHSSRKKKDFNAFCSSSNSNTSVHSQNKNSGLIIDNTMDNVSDSSSIQNASASQSELVETNCNNETIVGTNISNSNNPQQSVMKSEVILEASSIFELDY